MMESLMPATIEQGVVLFAFYAFCGWLIEVAYRSFHARHLVNPGFLRGPFVPLYAVGAGCVVLLGRPLAHWHPAALIPLFGVTLTVLEAAVGWLLERQLGVQLWSYEDNRFNWRGRVCLGFSLAWTALAVAFSWWIHPGALRAVSRVDPQWLRFFALWFLVALALDTTASVAEVRAFRALLGRLQAGFVARRDLELERQLGRLRRLLEAFPDLNLRVFAALRRNLQGAVQTQLTQNFQKFLASIEQRRPREDEWADLVADILEHPEFLRTREFPHHKQVTIFQHACAVSYLSYSICKKLNLDHRAAARGGLLHDFFLYDWRNHDVPDLPREKFHGFAHPRIALQNAEAHFALTDTERDCILRHMWPLTIVPPRTRESFIVSMVDKWVASRELLRRRP
jgi:uncharacterized membrane protein